MYNSNIPPKSELPSTAKLIKSTVIAAVAAFVILVVFVMPAEYGKDPTGLGKMIGLKRMGEIKTSLAEEAAADRVKTAQAEQPAQPVTAPTQAIPVAAEVALAPVPANTMTHEMKVTLEPGKGTEIKVTMEKGKTVKYIWWTDSGKANFDVHADSKELDIDYHGYEKGSAERKEAEITAAFNGNHGWFWRNRTSSPITITLQTSGEYTAIKEMK